MDTVITFPPNEKINQTNYYWFNTGFDEETIQSVEVFAQKFDFVEAVTVSDHENVADDHIRKSQIKWLPLIQGESGWIYNKIFKLMDEANSAIWGFDIHACLDSIQYTVYEEGGGHYDWHMDVGPHPINHRKISCVIQLSDANDYEGGDLQIWVGGKEPYTVPKGKGNVVFFPSFCMHRVTPITSGIRKSLVLWMGGDSYK
jgi:PKHD-type hydroxylase